MKNTVRCALLGAASLVLSACGGGPGSVGQSDEEDVIESYCASNGGCDPGVIDLLHFLFKAVKTANVPDEEQAFFADPNQCPKANQMTHFVDMARVVDGVPRFTSVQDFVIQADANPQDVANAFRRNWLDWWQGGTTRGPMGLDDQNRFAIEIRPLGFSIISIAMLVHEPEQNPYHPALESPDLDPLDGEHIAWDWGTQIEMAAPSDGKGAAFEGDMRIFARRTEQGVHVREMWRYTEPLSPLIMKYIPISWFADGDPTEARLRLSAFLHLSATEGCAVPRGTGYPGLIDAFESGRLP